MKKLLVSLLLLFVPTLAFAAIARSGTPSSGAAAATSVTFAHDNGSPTNGLTVVNCGNLQGVDDIVGVTYGGQAMVQMNAIDQTINNYLYALVNPPAGNNNVVCTFTGSHTIRATAASYSGVSQTGLPDSQNTGYDNNSGAKTVTVTTNVVASNSWLVGGSLDDGDTLVSGNASTNLVINGTSNQSQFWDSSSTVGTGNQSMKLTWGAPSDADLNLISIAPAVASAAVTRQRVITIFEE